MAEQLPRRKPSAWPLMAEMPNGDFNFPCHFTAWKVVACTAPRSGGEYVLRLVPAGTIDLNPLPKRAQA